MSRLHTAKYLAHGTAAAATAAIVFAAPANADDTYVAIRMGQDGTIGTGMGPTREAAAAEAVAKAGKVTFLADSGVNECLALVVTPPEVVDKKYSFGHGLTPDAAIADGQAKL